jgi:hypothetical protein
LSVAAEAVDPLGPVAWWFARPLEFFVTAAFLVEDVRSVALAARFVVAFVAEGFVPVAAVRAPVAACLLGAVFAADVFFALVAPFAAGPLGVFFVVLAFFVLAFFVLVFFA